MDDREKLFQEIKLFVKDWYKNNQSYFKDNSLDTHILRDEIDGFVVSFENKEAMAELVVEKAEYAPYRFVSFEIATVKNNQATISYSWYDNDSIPKKDIAKQLDKSVNYFINL